MIQLTPEQFENIRLILTQIASLAGSQDIRDIEALAESALAELRHGAIDSHNLDALGLEKPDISEKQIRDVKHDIPQ
ncbi:MAG TPA: hypothetical protein V6C57_29375 [Coleofasciculaceae cyanobacterium]